MSDSAALDVLLDRGIAYALTDRNLCLTDLFGSLTIFDAGRSEWLGKSLLDLVPELVGSEDALREILAGESPRFQIPWVNRDRLDGGISYYTLVSLPRIDARGGIFGLIHVVQDVTEIGTLEQQLMQQRNALRLLERTLREQNARMAAANAELERLDQAKSTFVSIAAHELRTPLASIAGYVEMLLDGDAGPLNARQVEFLTVVDAGAERLLRITRDLLDAARLEAGRMELTLRPVDLGELVDTVVAELRPQLQSRGQAVAFQRAPGLPCALVDPERVAQVLGNLLANAAKFGPPHSPVHVALALDPDDPGFLQMAVADRGPGIPPDDQARLFRPFERGATSSARPQSGAGLGLYISKSLVELHGGRIWLESTGSGASFFVTFPVASA